MSTLHFESDAESLNELDHTNSNDPRSLLALSSLGEIPLRDVITGRSKTIDHIELISEPRTPK